MTTLHELKDAVERDPGLRQALAMMHTAAVLVEQKLSVHSYDIREFDMQELQAYSRSLHDDLLERRMAEKAMMSTDAWTTQALDALHNQMQSDKRTRTTVLSLARSLCDLEMVCRDSKIPSLMHVDHNDLVKFCIQQAFTDQVT